MPILKFNNYQEIEVWNNMKQQLKIHNSRNVKDAYYKKGNMDIWEQEKRKIESDARSKIIQMQKIDKKKKEKETELEDVLSAAEALIMMYKNLPRPQERRGNRKKKVVIEEPPRRSERISEKEINKIFSNCPGCKDNQPNQMAHMGTNGCLGDDL